MITPCPTLGTLLVPWLLITSIADARPTDEGRRLYRVHCLGCHGEDATGSGPMRDRLETPPGDLTKIRQRNGGEFPFERVYGIIDGRETIPAHGKREMPVWGSTFQTMGLDHDQEHEVRATITALTRYLESIQQVPDEDP